MEGQSGRRARLARQGGKADTLLACLSVSHSRSVWRTRESGFVPSPAASGARSESGSIPAPVSDPQPTCAGRTAVLIPKSVRPRRPRRAKLGRSGLGAGRTHRALNARDLGVPDPGLARQPRCPYLLQEPRAKDQEKPFREQPHLPGEQGGGMGPGAGGSGCRRGGAAGGLGARSERGAGGGARAGEKVGSDPGGGRGRGSGCSNPGRAPRAPSRPAGGTEGDFHPDTPGTRPPPRCEADGAAGLWTVTPRGSGRCRGEGKDRAWEPRPGTVSPKGSARPGSLAAPGRGGSRSGSRTRAEVRAGGAEGGCRRAALTGMDGRPAAHSAGR